MEITLQSFDGRHGSPGDRVRLGLPLAHVARPRLVGPVVDRAIGIVEGGAGYGKSVLAAEVRNSLGVACAWVSLGPPAFDADGFAASLRRALRTARLSDLNGAMVADSASRSVEGLLEALSRTDDPLLIVLDDAHHLSDRRATELVIEISRSLPAPHRLLLTARALPRHLEAIRGHPGAVALLSRDLAFTGDEAAELVELVSGRRPTAYEVNVLLEETEGWPTAIVLAAATAVRQKRDGPPGPASALLASRMAVILHELTDQDRWGIRQLARLPHLSPGLADRATGVEGLFDRIVAAGVPLVQTAPGWWEMPGPLVSFLSEGAPLDRRVARGAASAYRDSGQVLPGIRTLLGAGLHDEAARALAALSPGKAEELGCTEMRIIVEALGDSAITSHPRVLLHLARVAELAYRADLRRAALERAFDIVCGRGDEESTVGHELDAERARDLVWDERTRQQARALAESVLQRTEKDEVVARCRALDALGRLSSWWSDDGPKAEAEPLLDESAKLARSLGHDTWAARALVPLAMGFHFALCHYDHALATLDRALADIPARNPYRGVVLNFRATVLIEMARYQEAADAIAHMHELAEHLGDEWLLALSWWSAAELASVLGDAGRTVGAVSEVERHRAEWFDETPGIEFLAQAADFLDRVGEHDRAIDYLARARAHAEGFGRVVRVYEASVLGRSGDARQAAAVLDAVLSRSDLDPQERWPLVLMRAFAGLRLGDAQTPTLAAAAFELCRVLCVGEAALRREPEVAERLLPLAAAAGSTFASDLMMSAKRFSLSLLGTFEVRRGPARIVLPAGRPARAVKAVAAAGGRLNTDQLLETLWPTADPVVARNRLRNLLSRVRTAAGALLEREGEIIKLSDNCELDFVLFEAESAMALSARASGDLGRASALASAALGRYRGEFLPDDRYEGWAAHPRERLRATHLLLLDLLARQADAKGDVDEAVRLVEQAIEQEPFDERPYRHLASLLASQGRVAAALVVVSRARAALGDLGLGLPEGLARLERTIRSGLPEPFERGETEG